MSTIALLTTVDMREHWRYRSDELRFSIRLVERYAHTRQEPLWITVLRPPVLALAFTFKIIHKVCFAWWLDPWLQKQNTNYFATMCKRISIFLYSAGELIMEKHPKDFAFDYAIVRIIFGNIVFCFRRGRNELNVSLSPRHAPNETHLLSVVIAVLDSKDGTEH